MVVVPPESGGGQVALISLAESGSVEVKRSVITLAAHGGAWRLSGFTNSSSPENAKEASSIPSPFRVELTDVVVRGVGDLFIAGSAARTEFEWKNGLLAVSGRMFDFVGDEDATRLPLIQRIRLDHVTASARQGFARMRMDAQRAYPVCISREATECVFVGERSFPWISLENLTVDDSEEAIEKILAKALDLRGRDNAYDEQNELLVKLTSHQGNVTRIGFDDASPVYFADKAPETHVRWLVPRPIEKPFEQQSAGEFLQHPGKFQPGFYVETLPNH